MQNEPSPIVTTSDEAQKLILGVDPAGPGEPACVPVMVGANGIVQICNPNSPEIRRTWRDEILGKEQPGKGGVLVKKEGLTIDLADAPADFDPGCDCGSCEGCVWFAAEKSHAGAEQVTAAEVGLTDSKVRHMIRMENTRQNKMKKRLTRARMAKASRKRNRVA